MSASKMIRVEIYDQVYNIRGDLDEAYVRQLAQYVDAKMRSLASQTQTIDSLRLAVLAALNLADEYQVLRARNQEVEAALGQGVARLSLLLDQALAESAAGTTGGEIA